jgi:ubiquinone/menaquinone biosynthesis C-methylase UbiE
MLITRNQICDKLNKNLIACELGVFKGEFSEILLNSEKFKKLYLVDIFTGEMMSGDKDGNNIVYSNGDELLNIVTNKFKDNPSIEIRKECSVKFLKSFSDEYFDFIYIDSSHQYLHTQNELNESYRVIKKNGGIISGHDYNEVAFKGVFDAVNEFSEKFNLKIHTTQQDSLASFFLFL